MLGRLPAEIRALTPLETDLLVRAWNEAQSDDVAAPTEDEYEDLVKRYG